MLKLYTALFFLPVKKPKSHILYSIILACEVHIDLIPKLANAVAWVWTIWLGQKCCCTPLASRNVHKYTIIDYYIKIAVAVSMSWFVLPCMGIKKNTNSVSVLIHNVLLTCTVGASSYLLGRHSVLPVWDNTGRWNAVKQ